MKFSKKEMPEWEKLAIDKKIAQNMNKSEMDIPKNQSFEDDNDSIERLNNEIINDQGGDI